LRTKIDIETNIEKLEELREKFVKADKEQRADGDDIHGTTTMFHKEIKSLNPFVLGVNRRGYRIDMKLGSIDKEIKILNRLLKRMEEDNINVIGDNVVLNSISKLHLYDARTSVEKGQERLI
jgi:hypothetical protein